MAPQADGVVANGTGSAVRSDINTQYAALWSNHSGSTEPSSGKVAYQFWADTNTGYLKIRNAANNAWVQLFKLDGTLSDIPVEGTVVKSTGESGGTKFLREDGDGTCSWQTVSTTPVGGATGVDFNDNVKVRFGTSNDLKIYHDALNSYINHDGTGNLRLVGNSNIILQDSNGEGLASFNPNGAVELFFNNVKMIETTASGGKVNGTLQCTSHVKIGDNDVYVAGDGDDLQLYHNGTDSYIANLTGKLYFKSDDIFWFVKNNGSNVLYVSPNGATILYNNSVAKLETGSSGITVYGSVTETSDIALKKDITPLSNSLAKVKQLNGYSYKFKDTDIASIGFTAQDVEKVYPDLVEGEEGEKGLNYSGLIAPLVEAVKELSTKIETLETKVAAL